MHQFFIFHMNAKTYGEYSLPNSTMPRHTHHKNPSKQTRCYQSLIWSSSQHFFPEQQGGIFIFSFWIKLVVLKWVQYNQ